MEQIVQNIQIINENIEKAAIKSGRNPEDITLLCVTKTIDVEKIKYLTSLGYKNLGENRVQELLSKYDNIADVNWHLIGSLQTNKVKYIIDKVKMIHSVDSLKLAQTIDKYAKQANLVMKILLEVNIAKEESKHGLDENEVMELIYTLSEYENIKVSGLMTVAPFVENPQDNAKYFEKMRKLFVDIRDKKIDNIDMKYLSMGMTNDYMVAIENGSNIVRIGTGIFGKRNYL